jgi:glycerophosphoryl diester phosphodiesterase
VARENTMASFKSAVRHGADMVEIDLRRSRDGAIVILHDPTLERLWGINKSTSDLALSEIRDIGASNERIPTFREVLDQISLPLMVDFTKREVVEGALRDVMDARAMERSLFVTGNVEALRMLRALSPDARIGLTWVEEDMPPVELFRELGAEYWNPMFTRVTPERVDSIHTLGLKVSTWTVDKKRDMRRMVEAGVDAIVSNHIADLVKFLDS